jgi:hypothetical protein
MAPTLNSLIELAIKHEGMGLECAKRAVCSDPWYQHRSADTARAANHFAVALALRAQAQEVNNGAS